MKNFGKRLSLFIAPLVIAVALWFAFYLFMGLHVKSKMETIATNEVLLMGDSQMQRINPAYFSKRAFNFASSGEHFYFTYHKLKTITSFENNNVKGVFLGISAHSFAPVYSRLFDPGSPEGKKSLGHFFYFFDDNEFFRKKDLLNLESLKRVVFGTPDWGGLFESDKANPDIAIINRSLKMHFGGTGADATESQLKYLDLIVELCEKNNIELIFVSTPYHPYYQENVAPEYFGLLTKTISEYPDVEYINFLSPPVSADLMSDGNHLNKIGAEIYSKLMNEAVAGSR